MGPQCEIYLERMQGGVHANRRKFAPEIKMTQNCSSPSAFLLAKSLSPFAAVTWNVQFARVNKADPR